MKRLIFLLIIFFGVQHLYAQQIATQDSLTIVSKIEDWNQAWKTKDATLAAKWYSADADFTNAFGFSMIGKKAIETYLTRVFNMDFVMAGNSEETSVKLKKVSDDTVLAITTIERKGQQHNDGQELGTRHTTHHRLFKKDKDWQLIAHLISDARSINTPKH